MSSRFIAEIDDISTTTNPYSHVPLDVDTETTAMSYCRPDP
jgi:hypothetical protein